MKLRAAALSVILLLAFPVPSPVPTASRVAVLKYLTGVPSPGYWREEGASAREAGTELIVTTPKDAVRMPTGFVSRPMVVLRVGLEITESADALKRLLIPWTGVVCG